MANPPFQVKGPPYPTHLPFYQTEALSWLMNQTIGAPLAATRFQTREQAIVAVRRLYSAGAVRVDVVVLHCEPWRLQKEGGPYANELEVFLPEGNRNRILDVIRSLDPDNWKMDLDEGEDPYPVNSLDKLASVTLSWD